MDFWETQDGYNAGEAICNAAESLKEISENIKKQNETMDKLIGFFPEMNSSKGNCKDCESDNSVRNCKTFYAKEWSCCIIDAFEDFLEEKGVKIPNDEKDADGRTADDTAANIYGSDFDHLMDDILIPMMTKAAKEAKSSVAINDTDWCPSESASGNDSKFFPYS